MSYLSKCEQVRPNVFAIKWRSTTGRVWTMTDGQACYVRYSRLGELLRNNHESERRFIADAIEQATGNRPTTWEGVT